MRRFPTLDHVWLFAAVALIALRPLLTTVPPHDFWWHMAMGRVIVQMGAIPTVDLFSYTQAGEPFYNQGWLAQVLLYGVHGVGGVELIVLVQAIVVAFSYGLLLLLCIRRCGDLRLSVGVLLMLVMPVSFNNWNVRPQTYAFPLFMAFFFIVTMWRTGNFGQNQEVNRKKSPAPLWLLPLLMVVWVNMHGSFVLGGVLIALTFIGEWGRRLVEGRVLRVKPSDAAVRPPLRSLFGWGAVTALAVLVNPRGIGVLGYVRDLLSTSSVTTLVTEWAPPTVRDMGGLLFFVFLMVCALVLAYTRRHPDPVDMLLVLPFLWLALGATRNIVWFAMVVAPVLTVQMASWFQSEKELASRFQGLPRMNTVLIGTMALMLVVSLPWIKPSLGLPPELGNLLEPYTPVEAVEVLQADPQRPQHLYHAMNYGSYLIWAAPEQPVFVDPRIELYPYEQWQDYIYLNAGNNVDALLNKYQVDGLLLYHEEQAGLLRRVRNDPSWTVRYEDEWTTYLVRQGS